MRVTAAVLFSLFGFPSVLAQNLVPNPGFEEFTSCPGSYTRTKEKLKLHHWYSPSQGTPDAFNGCSKGEGNVPYNWAGVSEAYEGVGYAGVYLWFAWKNFREYLQCKLTAPLLKDTTYIVTFKYRLSSYSKHCIDRIGLLLTDTAVRTANDRAWNIVPTINVIQDSALTLTTGLWESAQLEYLAAGDEQFLTIGNFDDNSRTRHYEIAHRPVQEPMLKDAAYYYIDDVVVKMKWEDNEMAPVLASFNRKDVRLDEKYILDNILFDFNSHKLLRRSFEQLEELVLVMKANPTFRVRIVGHTDDVGTENYNLHLSRMRAKTVAAYLIQSGIGNDRIDTDGYGKRYPLVEGDTDAARKINRRVELTFFQ